MNRFLSILLIFFICVYSSCSSLRKAQPSKTRINLDESKISLLNGKYKEESKIPNKEETASLSGDIFDVGYNPKSQNNFIEIKAISSNKLSVIYWDSTTILKSKIFKGKIVNDYFIFKKKYLVIPGIFINLYRNRSFRIGILPDKNLITDYSSFRFMTYIFIIPEIVVTKEFNVEFQRLD